jgi:hypothetical protein
VLLAMLLIGLILAATVLGAAWDAPRSPPPSGRPDRGEREPIQRALDAGEIDRRRANHLMA